MLKNRLFAAASKALLVSAFYIFHCNLPQDPNNPSNTSVTAIIRTSDWKQNTSIVSDTVDNPILIGAAINLPANIDSISIIIAENGVPVFDTLIRDFTSGNRDTVWKKMYFRTPGAKTVTITPYSSLNLPPVIAVITIVDRDGPQNQKPSITVPETTIIRPSETCLLTVHVSDDDTGQLLKVTMTGDPAGAKLLQDDTVFAWTAPSDFIGYDTITFFVTDNGTPPFHDTVTAVIIVTLTPNPPIIEVSGDRSLRPLETCTLILRASDSDTGQLLTLSMAGNPEGSIIKNDSLFIWTAPAGSLGEYKVTFTVTDNGDPPFSRSTIATITVIDGMVNYAPEWQEDTVKVDIDDTSSYMLLLASKCSDPDDDSITYTLLYSSPAGDTIRNGWYEFTATSAVTGTHIVRIVAADSGNPADTLFLRLIVSATTRVKPSITQQPADQSVTEGNKAQFTVTASGVPTPTYQWKKNGTDIVGANFATCTTGVATIADNGTLYQCIITNSAGTVLSASAKLIVDTLFTKPTITQQPHDTTVVTGGPASFSLIAAGTNLQYQWRKNDIALTTQPGSGVLALSAVTTADAGTYTVKVWNKVDSVISSAVRLLVRPKTPGAPTLTVQSATGIKVSWSAVEGAEWYRVLRSLNSGSFASVCSTTQNNAVDSPLVEGGNYSYRIIAGNTDGVSDTGAAATATTLKGPEIITQPTPAQVALVYGESVALSVAATGNPGCTYQWQKNGVDLAGKTTASLSIASVTVADSGSYRCVVTNSVRSVNSNAVKLTVLYTLNVTRTSTGGTITLVTDTAAYIPGASVTLTATASSGYRFVNWGGDVSSDTNPLTVAVNQDQMAITANYVRQYTLTVTSASAAQGSVTPTE